MHENKDDYCKTDRKICTCSVLPWKSETKYIKEKANVTVA